MQSKLTGTAQQFVNNCKYHWSIVEKYNSAKSLRAKDDSQALAMEKRMTNQR